MTKVAECLFNAAAVHHMHAAEFQAMILTRIPQGFKDMPRLIRANIDFPTQFTDIGYAMHTCQSHANFNFLGCAKGVYII